MIRNVVVPGILPWAFAAAIPFVPRNFSICAIVTCLVVMFSGILENEMDLPAQAAEVQVEQIELATN
jgi:hypothetical protein